jgi:hypothetical protein
MGEQIVVGKYYKRQGHSLQSYVLCDGRPTFNYSHSVIVAKFNMIITRHRQRGGRIGILVYILPMDVVNHIQSILSAT